MLRLVTSALAETVTGIDAGTVMRGDASGAPRVHAEGTPVARVIVGPWADARGIKHDRNPRLSTRSTQRRNPSPISGRAVYELRQAIRSLNGQIAASRAAGRDELSLARLEAQARRLSDQIAQLESLGSTRHGLTGASVRRHAHTRDEHEPTPAA